MWKNGVANGSATPLHTKKKIQKRFGLIENAILFFVQFITFLGVWSYDMQGCNTL